jgi:hypothetical protein
MTTEDSKKLSLLWDAYQKALEIYKIEKGDNYLATQGWSISGTQGSYQDKPHSWWAEWKQGSDASLKVKTELMEDSKAAYELFKKDVTAADQLAFQIANPQIAVQLQEQAIKGQNESKAIELAAKNDALKTATNANYADKANNTVLIVVIVVVVLVVVSFFIIRSRRNKKGGAAIAS